MLCFSRVRRISPDLLALSKSALVIDSSMSLIKKKNSVFGLTLMISTICIPIGPAAESSRTLKVADPRSVSRWNTAKGLLRIVFDWSGYALSIQAALGEDAPESNVEADLFIT